MSGKVKHAYIHASLKLIVSKMGLTTLVAKTLKQTLFKEQNCDVWAVFLRMHLFVRLKHFFSPITCPVISALSVLTRIHKVHVFDEVFYPLCNCCCDN